MSPPCGSVHDRGVASPCGTCHRSAGNGSLADPCVSGCVLGIGSEMGRIRCRFCKGSFALFCAQRIGVSEKKRTNNITLIIRNYSRTWLQRA